jgi:hypothetical protein
MLIFSLPSKHNSGYQLPEELPGDLLHAPLIWVHCGGIIPSLQRFYDSPYSVLHRSPSSFTIQVGARDKIVSVNWLKPYTDTDAEPTVCDTTGNCPAPEQWPSQPPSTTAVHLRPVEPLFSDSLVSTPSHQDQPSKHPGTVFSQPCRGLLHAPSRGATSQPPQQRYPQRQQRLPVRINL